MSSNELVNIDAISSVVGSISQDGDNVVMDESANKQIADFKEAKKLMEQAEDLLKKHIRVALEPFNSQSIKGRYATISLTKPREPSSKYKVDNLEFLQEKTILVPDNNKIDEYKLEHGDLPYGVTENKPGTGGLAIRLKETNGQ